MENDDPLVRRMQDRDGEALGELMRRHGPALFAFLAGRLGRADAEDAYAEVWMKVWNAAQRYEHRGRFRAWLFAIAHRASLDVLESRRRPQSPLDELAAEPASREPGPEAQAEAADLSARLGRALAALPPEQREVFLMRESAGLSFAEISEALDCPLGTALARMRYAVLKLRERLKAHA